MLILYSNIFTIPILKNVIKLNKLRFYSKLNKYGLINLINRHKSAIIIQKCIRKKFNQDSVCPITLCEYTYPFVCIKNINVFKYYSLIDFVEYLNKSTDFRDPLTREKISDESLKNISSLLKYYRINNTKYNNKLKKTKQSRSDYLRATHYINNVINYIMNTENLSIDSIYNTILPQIMYYFQYLLNTHRNYCRNLLNQYINIIEHHSNDNKLYIIDYLKLIISLNNL